MKFAFIRDMDGENKRMPREERFPVSFMCGMLEVSRAGYYAWLKRAPSARAMADGELTALIVAIDVEHKGRYGVDRIHRELARRGHAHSPRRVRRRARAAGPACGPPRPHKVTTVPGKGHPSATASGIHLGSGAKVERTVPLD